MPENDPRRTFADLVDHLGLDEAATEALTLWADHTLSGGASEAEGAAADPLPTHRERYELLQRLGEGGMGEVWRVRDRDLDRVTAMKILHSELAGQAGLLARFVEEARLTARLQHPAWCRCTRSAACPTGGSSSP